MKILFICNDLPYFCAHRLALARHAIGSGHQVTLASGVYDAAAAAKLPPGVELEVLDIVKHRTAPLSDVRLATAIRRLVDRHRPDLVHSITMKPNLAAAVALSGMKSPPPLVMTFPGMGKVFEPGGGAGARLRRAAVLALFRRARQRLEPVATVENGADAAALARYGLLEADRIHITMGAGIDLARFRPAARSGAAKVLFASRLIRAKGVEIFIEAARRLGAETGAEFLLAGPLEEANPDRLPDEVLAAAKRDGAVRFLGAVDPAAMPALLQDADIFCAPTLLREGLPRACIEAMACGCAVVASDQPSTRQIIVEGEIGWLLRPVNAKQLVRRLEHLLSDIEATRRLGARASEELRKLPVSETAVNAVFERAWKQALASKQDATADA